MVVSALIDGDSRALGVRAATGEIAWNQSIPAPVFESISTPAVAQDAGVALFAAGSQLTAISLADGSVAWRTMLGQPVVDASPVVTTDLGARQRAFIVEYGGFGGPSQMYCINISPRQGSVNPYDPGQTVWSVFVGSAVGATAAYANGVVYVASTGLDGPGNGEVRAFSATATMAPAPLWSFTNPIDSGFFGGLALRQSGGTTFVYGASYAFGGGMDSSNLVKLNGATGALVWSAPCNRTESMPIVLPDGRIVLSTGISGFGSQPSVELFRDNGISATLLWDTALATWQDTNHDGALQAGEFIAAGGWTNQPVLLQQPGSPKLHLLVGSLSTDESEFGVYNQLMALDLSKNPGQAGFFAKESVLSVGGATPAAEGGSLYTIGKSGLTAFGPRP